MFLCHGKHEHTHRRDDSTMCRTALSSEDDTGELAMLIFLQRVFLFAISKTHVM